MRVLILAAALLPPPSTPAADPAPRAREWSPSSSPPLSNSECRRPSLRPAETPIPKEAKRLGELPPGDLILTVYREIDGCLEPVIVRQDVGATRH